MDAFLASTPYLFLCGYGDRTDIPYGTATSLVAVMEMQPDFSARPG